MSLLKYLCLLLLPTSFSPLTCLYTFSLYWPPLCLSFTFLLFISLSHAVLSLSNTHTHKQTHTRAEKVLAYISHGICNTFSFTGGSNVLEQGTCCAELIWGERHIHSRTPKHTLSPWAFKCSNIGRKCNKHLPVNADIAYNLYTIIKSVIQEKVSEPHLREDS